MEGISIRHTALSAETLRLTTRNVNLVNTGATGLGVYYTTDGRRQRFRSSVRGLGGAYVLDQIGDDPEILDYEGGVLVYGRLVATDKQTNAVEHYGYLAWEGARHSLFTSRVSSFSEHASLDVMVSVLSEFHLVEAADGLVLQIREGARARIGESPPSVVKHLNGLGLIEARKLTRDAMQGLPSWGGTPVGNGEMYRETVHTDEVDHASDEAYYVFVNESVRLVLMPDAGVLDADVMAGFDDLQIDWLPVGVASATLEPVSAP